LQKKKVSADTVWPQQNVTFVDVASFYQFK